MQDVTAAALAGLGGAVVALVGYHVGVAGPRFRSLADKVERQDALLGGDAGIPGSRRLAELEAAAARLHDESGDLRSHVEALERAARAEFPRIGFVRYNAFDDVGSDQSYALALLTREGDGVVLTSIYSREEVRTYGKAVEKFQTAQDASREERAAILKAKAASA